MKYDKIILGAGIYGLYAALFCGSRGEKILVIECDTKAFGRLLILIRPEFIWDTIIRAPFQQL